MISKTRCAARLVGGLIVLASMTVHAQQPAPSAVAEVDPSASCLGIAPCSTLLSPLEEPVEASPDVSGRLPDAHPRRYRGARFLYENGERTLGSEAAEAVLERIYALPEDEKNFLLAKLKTARGFAIFPEVRKSGVMAATVYGRGILAFRDDRYEWSTPILLSMQGHSVGPQFCAQCSRIIFIFDRICSVRDFLAGHHHISTTPAGTVVKHVDHPEPEDPMGISIYTLQDGISVGQSIDSYSIHIDEAGNAELYGVDFSPACLVEGVVAGPKTPWMLKFFQKMALPPGTPDRTINIR